MVSVNQNLFPDQEQLTDFMDNDMKGTYPSTVHDWMVAIRRPVPYRVGNAKLHIKPRFLAYAAIFAGAVLILVVMFLPNPSNLAINCPRDNFHSNRFYNSIYPLSKPILTEAGLKYRIAIIADLDTQSFRKSNTWISYMKLGNLTISDDFTKISVEFESKMLTLSSTLSQGGRGMELSELVTYNGNLYTVDDRTGVVYLIKNNNVIPWVVLTDGNGESNKGFKSEWACVKDENLYVGSLGKEWTSTTGVVKNLNPQWIKVINKDGAVKHIDWHENYNALRKKTRTMLPGYLIHESAVWSTIHRRWFFLPRRLSRESYDENADERRATNILISCDEKFSQIQIRYIQPLNPTHGYSSFKFVPGTHDTVIIALKSEEDNGNIASYIQSFNINGNVLLAETKIGNQKFEGIEFI
ncbi:soluble calcium-activated nucleotidase 1 [Octopus bimaculoides]|uniref:Soluble calcium-activated nucleotidase 1 n=1 Tax=Octopus bimaculoides TaxID=37653 RepID=A0A0L8HKB5_OCTBM|nr:soluble calcium-activated nucleotidase 1 [Octopus bimaculoides]|eukprot:XP_014771650.1 PREDICTED: soluble calcium-activated nucleotidase 1-like [Octopus bimaculoides]